MTAPTVPTTELTGYCAVAAELHRIADSIAGLTGKPTFVSLGILPEGTVDAVDAVALAAFGRKGETERDGGYWRHRANNGHRGPVYLSVHATVPGPPDARDVELERLRAEVEALRSATATEAAGLDYSREADDPEAGPVPAYVAGGPVTGRGGQ